MLQWIMLHFLLLPFLLLDPCVASETRSISQLGIGPTFLAFRCCCSYSSFFLLVHPLPGTCSGACIRKSLTNLLRCSSVSCCKCRCRRPTPRALIKIHGRLINRQFTHLIEFPSASYYCLLCCCCCCFYSYYCFLGAPPSAAVVMQFHFWLG